MSEPLPLLLVVDDEPDILEIVSRFGRRAGFEAITCGTGREAIDTLKRRKPDVALVDLRMPGEGGLDVLRGIRDAAPGCQPILMTGFASVDTAVEAVKLGAMDYLSKPLDFERLGALLQTVREDLERRRSLLSIERELAHRLEFCGMIGRSPVMQELFAMIRRLAPHARTALITGETGTGKELVARALHKLGPRRETRFVTVNCSAVVESLFESELFGHMRGAFTGATDNKPGLFEAADGGTLFLDEVGELPLGVQAKLLRVLEYGEVHRVGSLAPKKVDVRVIAATNRDLHAQIAAGRFRSDLYYRLNMIEVKLPTLHSRREDIPYLTAAFVESCASRLQKPIRGITAAAERLLVSAPWEGNVRELRNVIERACILSESEFITERDFEGCMPTPLGIGSHGRRNTEHEDGGTGAAHVGPMTAEQTPDSTLLSTVERDHVIHVLEHARGNKKVAAQALGISRRALYRLLERLDMGETITRRGEQDAEAEPVANA